MEHWYLIYHHPRGPWAVGPYDTDLDAIQDAGSNPLPPHISILRAAPEDGRIGRCTVYPPRKVTR